MKEILDKMSFFFKCHLFEGINFELQIDYCLIVFLEKHFIWKDKTTWTNPSLFENRNQENDIHAESKLVTENETERAKAVLT